MEILPASWESIFLHPSPHFPVLSSYLQHYKAHILISCEIFIKNKCISDWTIITCRPNTKEKWCKKRCLYYLVDITTTTTNISITIGSRCLWLWELQSIPSWSRPIRDDWVIFSTPRLESRLADWRGGEGFKKHRNISGGGGGGLGGGGGGGGGLEGWLGWGGGLGGGCKTDKDKETSLSTDSCLRGELPSRARNDWTPLQVEIIETEMEMKIFMRAGHPSLPTRHLNNDPRQ